MSVNVNSLLAELVQENGSDLLLATGFHPSWRRYGTMAQREELPKLTEGALEAILQQVLSQAERVQLESDQDLDFAYEFEVGGGHRLRFRGNAYIQSQGKGICFRAISSSIPTFEQVGFPAEIGRDLMDHHQGLVMVTGPTGAGKTTTLAALLNHVNTNKPLNIITLEDPIEFIHPSKQSLVVQRQVGKHSESFAAGLKAALREDPDVLLVGELRDLETISLCITAAETGHLVLTTMNTLSAGQTISRLVNAFPPSQQSQVRSMVADSLKGIISQQLVPNLDENQQLMAYELLLVNPAAANLVRDNKMHQISTVMQTSAKLGMRLMDDSLFELANEGAIDKQLAVERAHDPANMKMRLKTEGGKNYL